MGKMIVERFRELVAKLFSLKTIVFIVASVFFVMDKMPWYGWMTAAGMFIGARYLEKLKGVGYFGQK